MNIWTNWDPLKEVIVGDCYAPGDLDWALDKQSRYKFNIILEETKEDLQNLADYISKLGVRVHRPKITNYGHDVDLKNFIVTNPTAPLVPRDQYLAYGHTIYQTYTSMPDRYLDSVNYNHIFQELFDRGYNWVSQPPPILDTLVEKWWANGQDVYHRQLKDRLLWHTATMFKCGDKLITNCQGPGTAAGLMWMQRNVEKNAIVDVGNTHQQGWGHIDHGWFMTDDDTVFCVNINWVPEPLRNKKIFALESLFEKFDDVKFITDYQSTGGKYSSAWLDKWLTEWKGYAQEVFFDSNVLVIDPKNVLFSNEQPKIFKLMQSQGINCHVVKQRHGLFWESGIHCLTLDLVRSGDKRSIIN
jgi:glycine amidinotransferase